MLAPLLVLFIPPQIALVAFLVLFGMWSRVSWFSFQNYPFTVGSYFFFFPLHYTLSGLGAASRLFCLSPLTRIMCVLLSGFQGACFELQGVFGALAGRRVLGLWVLYMFHLPSSDVKIRGYGFVDEMACGGGI